jgi:hypothetical protein
VTCGDTLGGDSDLFTGIDATVAASPSVDDEREVELSDSGDGHHHAGEPF